MSERPTDRPQWVHALSLFISDEIIDEEYGYPMDGSDDCLLDEIERAVDIILCRRFGHDIIDDQCGIPEHRFCVFCNRREPDIIKEESS